MKKLLLVALAILTCNGVSVAQKGTAESDYYPMNYAGDTWTGEVTSLNEDTREFTLTYKKKDKEETFVGVLPKGYTHKTEDGKDREVKMADLMGMRIKVYYITKTKKVNDQKIKSNEVFKIRIVALGK